LPFCFIPRAKNRKKSRKKSVFFKTAVKAEDKGLKQGHAANTPAIPGLEKCKPVPRLTEFRDSHRQ
jgi:ribosomal protein S30